MGESHRIFLVRHGETDWNKDLKYQGNSDIELNEAGIEQARRLGVRLRGTIPARVVSSPLSRACRTAEVIMENNGGDAKIEKLEDLREISFGIWEGLSMSDVRNVDGETLDKWKARPFSITPKGGETLEEIIARSKRAAANILEYGRPGAATFVVAHGAILRSVLAALMGVEDIDILWRFRVDNCSLTIVDMWGRRPSLYALNDTHHCRLGSDEEIGRLAFSL
ncbi:MAG: histidine phosphatase family protein [Synergistaceae bacterium]|jgi:alpha-ribazole phosphatase/probable phosphoglycerate mutase|nr:histidine phosphatase family protein [Synergistaceae bacterium]